MPDQLSVPREAHSDRLELAEAAMNDEMRALARFECVLLASSGSPEAQESLITQGKWLAEQLSRRIGAVNYEEMQLAIGFRAMGWDFQDIVWELESRRIEAGAH